MTTTKILPFLHGGGTGNNRNVIRSIGHLNIKGFIIPKYETL